MKKIAFITGITGQDGSYLSELLIEKGYKIYGIVRRNSILYNFKRIDHIRENINLKYGEGVPENGQNINNFPGCDCGTHFEYWSDLASAGNAICGSSLEWEDASSAVENPDLSDSCNYLDCAGRAAN